MNKQKFNIKLSFKRKNSLIFISFFVIFSFIIATSSFFHTHIESKNKKCSLCKFNFSIYKLETKNIDTYFKKNILHILILPDNIISSFISFSLLHIRSPPLYSIYS